MFIVNLCLEDKPFLFADGPSLGDMLASGVQLYLKDTPRKVAWNPIKSVVWVDATSFRSRCIYFH